VSVAGRGQTIRRLHGPAFRAIVCRRPRLKRIRKQNLKVSCA
jgi:hypothetical protein